MGLTYLLELCSVLYVVLEKSIGSVGDVFLRKYMVNMSEVFPLLVTLWNVEDLGFFIWKLVRI